MYNLPRRYLSWSALSLWEHSPKQFRKRYYESKPLFITPELAFGKHIGELLENADDSLAHIKRYNKPEQPLRVTIAGVPVIGFVDSFDTKKKQLIEYKTGKKPWDQERVNEHGQLDLYSLAVQHQFGTVHDTCHLIWLETENCEQKSVGLISHEESHRIRLTGTVHEFERVITQDERDAMAERLVKVATEISDDYTAWQEEHKVRGLVPKT